VDRHRRGKVKKEEVTVQEPRAGARWLWFVGGFVLSVTTLCSIVLLVMLLISTSLNAYLAWTMSGYEVSIIRPEPVSTVVVVVTPTAELAMAPTDAPTVEPISTPVPAPTESMVEVEAGTLAAIATNAAEEEPACTPIGTPVVIAPDTSEAAGAPTPGTIVEAPTAAPDNSVTAEALDASVEALTTSTNSYDLIPLEAGRDDRPPDEHGDLNLKLRDPQPTQAERSLVEIPGSGIDPQAPKLSSVFKPDFVATYTIHGWDWGCNCKGNLILDEHTVLVGIKTTPGEPLFIPRTERDIYQGKYYAVVLYASEDSLAFLYAREGTVARGYTIHYLGLQTDPNLLALYRESPANELPGLALDTPVGIATDELIVGVRDNGTFLDARSKRDWWE
jgi:hypothetical protein